MPELKEYSDRLHRQWTIPEISDDRFITAFPTICTVNKTLRGQNLQLLVQKLFLGNKIAKEQASNWKGTRIFSYEVTDNEAKIFHQLALMTDGSYKYKIWNELSKLPTKQLKEKILLLYITFKR